MLNMIEIYDDRMAAIVLRPDTSRQTVASEQYGVRVPFTLLKMTVLYGVTRMAIADFAGVQVMA